MTARFGLLASVQNTAYMAWMALLFAYSCRKNFPTPPTLAVHVESGRPLLPEFGLASAAGALVLPCQDRTAGEGLVDYPPRNTPGALLDADVDAEFVVLCDADFVFLRPVRFDRLGAGPGVATMDSVNYMEADAGDTASWLAPACARAGADFVSLRGRGRQGGVPHVVHASDRARLARTWLDVVERFANPGPQQGDPIPWTASMWAFVLAAEREEIALVTTRLVVTNWRDDRFDAAGPPVLHYCMGDAAFEKRDFCWRPGATWDVWDVRPTGDGSAGDRVRAEIAEAAAFYGLDDPAERERLLGRTRDQAA